MLHVGVSRVQRWCGNVKEFPQISRLLQTLAPGVPMGLSHVGNFCGKLGYENLPSSGPSLEANVYALSTGRNLIFKRAKAPTENRLQVSWFDTTTGRKF